LAGPPLAALKKGLETLQKEHRTQAESLRQKLARNERISKQDEAWLDGEANLVDEEQLVDKLSKALDYQQEVGCLSEEDATIFQRLVHLLEPKKAGAKQKRPENIKPAAQKVKEPPKPVFTCKEVAKNWQRIEVLDWFHAHGENQSETARHFKPIYPNLRIKQPLVSNWKKWRERFATEGGALVNAKQLRQTQHPEVTEMLELWVVKAMEDGIVLQGEVLRQKWAAFADLAGILEDERLNHMD
ncbi:hypothetical protein F5890DRAFT_1592654, partial [Lentinula detonsa]